MTLSTCMLNSFSHVSRVTFHSSQTYCFLSLVSTLMAALSIHLTMVFLTQTLTLQLRVAPSSSKKAWSFHTPHGGGLELPSPTKKAWSCHFHKGGLKLLESYHIFSSSLQYYKSIHKTLAGYTVIPSFNTESHLLNPNYKSTSYEKGQLSLYEFSLICKKTNY